MVVLLLLLLLLLFFLNNFNIYTHILYIFTFSHGVFVGEDFYWFHSLRFFVGEVFVVVYIFPQITPPPLERPHQNPGWFVLSRGSNILPSYIGIVNKLFLRIPDEPIRISWTVKHPVKINIFIPTIEGGWNMIFLFNPG